MFDARVTDQLLASFMQFGRGAHSDDAAGAEAADAEEAVGGAVRLGEFAGQV